MHFDAFKIGRIVTFLNKRGPVLCYGQDSHPEAFLDNITSILENESFDGKFGCSLFIEESAVHTQTTRHVMQAVDLMTQRIGITVRCFQASPPVFRVLRHAVDEETGLCRK